MKTAEGVREMNDEYDEIRRACDETIAAAMRLVAELKAQLAAAQAEIAMLKNEYICKCGLRIEPHRCKIEEF